MTRHIVACMVTVAVTCATVEGTAAGAQPAKPRTTKVRIGAFDSRAIAMAHFGRLVREGLLEQLYAGHRKATASGDDKRAAELATKGQLIQKLLHRQMFGAARPDDALAEIKPSLPKLADSLGVSIIVSVHDIAFQSPSVEVVDVTMEIVELFHPDQETLDKIKAVLDHPPTGDSVIDRMESGYPPKDAGASPREQPPPSKRSQASFRPATEQVFIPENPDLGVFVDLESGKVVQVREDVKESHSPEKLIAWAKETQVDVIVRVFPGPRCYLSSLESYLYRSKSTSWQETTADDVLANRTLRDGDLGYGNITKHPDDLPAVYMFKSREGNAGLLEIVEFVGTAEDGRGVKIRFKVVQMPDTPAAANASPDQKDPENK